VVKAGVVNDPVVPVPPPLGELQDVLLVDDQLTVVVEPFAIEDGDAARVTVGPVGFVYPAFTVVSPPPPPHDARMKTADSAAK